MGIHNVGFSLRIRAWDPLKGSYDSHPLTMVQPSQKMIVEIGPWISDGYTQHMVEEKRGEKNFLGIGDIISLRFSSGKEFTCFI